MKPPDQRQIPAAAVTGIESGDVESVKRRGNNAASGTESVLHATDCAGCEVERNIVASAAVRLKAAALIRPDT